MKKHYLGPLAILLACTMPANGSAQEPSRDRPVAEESGGLEPEISGKTLVRIFEEVLRTQSVKSLIAASVEEMSTVGDVEEGWSERGVALDDLLEHQGDGPTGSIIVGKDESSYSFTTYGPEPLSMPDRIHSVTVRDGEPNSPGLTSLISYAPGFWIEVAGGEERIGNASCNRGFHRIAVHSDRSPDRWSAEDVAFMTVLYGITRATEDLDLCAVYELNSDGALTSRAYNRDGQPYPIVNETEETLEIHPASKSADLISRLQAPNPFAQ